ncbi:porin [Vagococcus sp. WN89Y]|uniref:porin n=1 Tax=Vagococcus sp. WN89Y TaxID=3457258 RepID=UPI003FCD4CC0
MKKILSVLIPALLMAGTSHAAEIYNKEGNKLDFYGKVDARHLSSHDKKNNGDATYVRFGFKGETQINTQLTGYGQWEYNIQGNKTENDAADTATRLAFAGLSAHEYGSFDYGRNYGVIYDVEAITDMLPAFGGDSYSTADNFMTGRANSLATYRNRGLFGLVDGLDFAVQYQGKNGAAGESVNARSKVLSQNGEGWGGAVSWHFGDSGVTAIAAYAGSKRTGDQRVKTFNNAKNAEAWASGLKYDANNIYLAANYAETHNMTALAGNDSAVSDKAKNLEAIAQYQFDFGLRPSLAYLQSKARKNGQVYTQLKYIEIGSYYYFNKNMTVYADYKLNLLKHNDAFVKARNIKTDDILALGIIYQF